MSDLLRNQVEMDFDPMRKSLYHYRPLVLLGVLTFWVISLIEGVPQSNLVHEQLDEFINPGLRRLSLWQGNWDLFAPEMDHWNTSLECVVLWHDGTESQWTTLDWTNASNWDRMRNFRRNEYFDGVGGHQGHLLWSSLSDHIVHQLSLEEGKTARWANLSYREELLPTPEVSWRKAYTEPDFSEPQKFYSWSPHEITESEIMLFGN